MSTPDPTSSPLDTLTEYVAANAGKPQDDRYWAGWMATVAKVQAEIRARPTPDDGHCSSCGRPFAGNVRSALGLPNSTPLAQRLVDAAGAAIRTPWGDWPLSATWVARAPGAACAAVLRGLADHIHTFDLMQGDDFSPTFDGGMHTAYAQLANTFAITANAIEGEANE